MLPKIYQTVGNRYQLSLLMTVVTAVNPRGPLLEPAVHQKLKLLPHLPVTSGNLKQFLENS